jgi:stress-induced morphogen
MTRKQADMLAQSLRRKFGGETEFEAVNKQGRYRFAIVSKRFNKMSQLKRQDEVWKIVDQVLPRGASMDISTILAYAPADLAEVK